MEALQNPLLSTTKFSLSLVLCTFVSVIIGRVKQKVLSAAFSFIIVRILSINPLHPLVLVNQNDNLQLN